MPPRRRDLDLVWLTILATSTRVAYWVLVTPTYVPDSDANQYQEIATNLAAGRGYVSIFPQLALHQTAFRPPGYPALLGAAFAIFGSHIVVGRMLNLVLGVVVVVLASMVARTIAGRRAGIVAGVVVALYPPLIANDVVLLAEPLALVTILLMVLALAHRRPYLAAVACGLLMLTKPSAQGIAILVAVWLAWQLDGRTALRFLAVTALVITPWVVRNWVQVGSPGLVTSNGFNLAAAYSPQARERGGFVDPVNDPAFDDLRLAQFDEAGWQRTLQRQAMQSLKDHPGQVVRVARHNAMALAELRPSNNEAAEVWDGRNLDFRRATLPAFYVVTAVGLYGLARRWRDPLTLLLVGIAGFELLATMVSVPAPRLRAPFDLICCIGVGLAFASRSDRRPIEDEARPPSPGAGAVLGEQAPA